MGPPPAAYEDPSGHLGGAAEGLEAEAVDVVELPEDPVHQLRPQVYLVGGRPLTPRPWGGGPTTESGVPLADRDPRGGHPARSMGLGT